MPSTGPTFYRRVGRVSPGGLSRLLRVPRVWCGLRDSGSFLVVPESTDSTDLKPVEPPSHAVFESRVLILGRVTENPRSRTPRDPGTQISRHQPFTRARGGDAGSLADARGPLRLRRTGSLPLRCLWPGIRRQGNRSVNSRGHRRTGDDDGGVKKPTPIDPPAI